MTTDQPSPDDPRDQQLTRAPDPATSAEPPHPDPSPDNTPLWPPTVPLGPVAGAALGDRPAWAPPRQEPPPRRLPSVARVVASIIVLVAVFAAGIGVGKSDGSGAAGAGSAAVPASLPPGFATYTQAWQILHTNYVDPSALDDQKLIYGSISGLVQAVGDTGHTRFLTPAEVKDENTSLSGEIVGIGALMNTDQNGPIIQSVIPGGPADRAGLRSGDKVLAVDGATTDGLDIDAVVRRIRGDAGTTVRLSILHDGDGAPTEYSIVREKVTVPAVSWSLIPGTTFADIRLEEFSDGAAKQLKAAIVAARQAGATGIVLDLRNDPGGYVGEAVDVASQFLKDGIVFEQRDRSGKITTSPVKPGGAATDTPLEVLVDLGTASSAEIVAGALQDAGRGKLIGHTTFGTGTVLSQYKLTDGSAMFVGTVEWLTRDGRQIWKQGIQPDIPVESNPAGKIVPPSDFSKLGADGLASSGDAPLLKAVELLKGN
jgi:carboxyl-terminal processing protease